MGSSSSHPLPPSSSSILHLLWIHSHSFTIYSSLSSTLLREVHAYLLPAPLLVDITSKHIRWFNTEERTLPKVVKLHRPVSVSLNSRWLLLSNGQVICCGGGGDPRIKCSQPVKTVYLIHHNGAVDLLPGMLKARGSQGMIEWRSHVMVFGGGNLYTVNRKLLTESEHFPLIFHKNWRKLPKMTTGRSNFNPCFYHNFVFLCGFGSEEMEAFDPVASIYIPLNVKLRENTPCCLLTLCNSLVVWSYQYIHLFSCEEPGKIQEKTRVERQKQCLKYQNSQPVTGKDAIWCIWDHQIWSFSSKTGAKHALNLSKVEN